MPSDELNLTALRGLYKGDSSWPHARFILRQIERVEGCECNSVGDEFAGWCDEAKTIPCDRCSDLRADLLALQKEVLG